MPLVTLAGCNRVGDAGEPSSTTSESTSAEENSTWSTESHSNDAAPDYERVFSTDEVHEIRITLTADDWAAMQEDVEAAVEADVDPEWFSSTVSYDGRDWYHVGMRYKGLSTIEDVMELGSQKFPFKLTFDRFEDSYPDTKNQRFYGFKKFVFSSSAEDESLIREVLASEIFIDSGIPAARASFARVYVEVGDSTTYWGLYTLLEDPDDDPMQDAQLGGTNGNLYKPSGAGADWSVFSQTAFEKKNNEEAADYSDVEAAVAAVHADATSAADYRAGVEAVFDASGFVRWLAVNTAMANKDAYGCKTRNYYLYGAPDADGRLSFFPTDLDEAMSHAGGPCGTPDVGEENDLLFTGDWSAWPLIDKLLADEVYRAEYLAVLGETLAGPLLYGDLSERALALHLLIAPYVTGDEGEVEAFTNIESVAEFDNALVGEGEMFDEVEAHQALLAAALSSE